MRAERKRVLIKQCFQMQKGASFLVQVSGRFTGAFPSRRGGHTHTLAWKAMRVLRMRTTLSAVAVALADICSAAVASIAVSGCRGQ